MGYRVTLQAVRRAVACLPGHVAPHSVRLASRVESTLILTFGDPPTLPLHAHPPLAAPLGGR
jgi:hypothetical protein